MDSFFQRPGFLGTDGTLGPDLSLLLSLVALALLTLGVVLARRKQYEAHRWIQTAAVCVSVVPTAAWMIRSLRLYVLPGLPGNLVYGSYVLTAVHAVVGAVAVVMGVVLVVRGTQLMAAGRSLTGYRAAMGVAYLAYVVGTALGVALYIVLYA